MSDFHNSIYGAAVATHEMAEGVRSSEDGLTATFYARPIQDVEKSEVEGRPVFVEHDYIKVLIPHDNKTVVDREVQDGDKQRWPKGWQAYMDGRTGEIVGTPLNEWNFLTATQRMELQAQGIQSVEELANMADGHMGKLGPNGRQICERARQFIEGGDKIEQELRGQIQSRDTEIASLMAANQQQGQEIDALRAEMRALAGAFKQQQDEKPEPPKRRGRPPKAG